jgi:hypothetical protein
MTIRRILAFLLLFAAPLATFAQSLGPDFRELEARLRLDPFQKALFDEAAGATRRALLATAVVAFDVKGRFDEELRKPRPDLGRLVGDPEDLVEQVRPQWREARDAWSALYETLDARQAAIARDYIERRLGTFDEAAGLLLKGWRERSRP